MKSVFKNLIYSVAALASVCLTACDSGTHSDAKSGSAYNRPEIVIAGSSFASSFFNKAIETYNETHKEVEISYQSIGSGAGIQQFIQGDVDIGTTDAPLNNEEAAYLADGFEEVIITSGMISLAYNVEGVSDSLNLPRDVYADIFLGKIKRWNDPRISAANTGVALPDRAIQVIARADSSGTTFAFTNHLAAVSTEWKAAFGASKTIDWPGTTMVAKGNEGVSQRLAITKNSIGYVEYGFATRLGLKVARLENKSGQFVLPGDDIEQIGFSNKPHANATEIASAIADPEGASAYPIVAYTWALIRKQYGFPGKAAEAKAFLNWTLNDGQKLARPLHYLPLSSELVQVGEDKLAY